MSVTVPRSTTWDNATRAARATGPAPSTARACGPGLASWRAATPRSRRSAWRSGPPSRARRTRAAPGRRPRSGPPPRRLPGADSPSRVSTGGWPSAPDFRCSAAPGTCSWLAAATAAPAGGRRRSAPRGGLDERGPVHQGPDLAAGQQPYRSRIRHDQPSLAGPTPYGRPGAATLTGLPGRRILG